MPLVSVVIPSYNNAAYIAATMESVLAQTLTDFELVVADHSSTDGTPEVLARFADDPRVRILTTPAGGGAKANWDRVSREAAGEFVKLVCGDDLLQPQALQVQVSALQDHPGAAMVASQRRIVDARGEQIVARRGLAGLTGVIPGPRAVRRSVVVGSNIFGEPLCVLMRRAALTQVGLWDAAFPYLIDQVTYSRILGTGDLLALPEVVGDFRLSSTQWSVDLANSQARQARGFHHWAAQTYPEAISKVDVARGDVRATAMAYSRRTLYWVLARRMRAHADQPVPTTAALPAAEPAQRDRSK